MPLFILANCKKLKFHIRLFETPITNKHTNYPNLCVCVWGGFLQHLCPETALKTSQKSTILPRAPFQLKKSQISNGLECPLPH